MKSGYHILMTGATGFLGSKVADALLNNGFQITILTRSFSSLERVSSIRDRITIKTTDQDLDALFSECRFDAVLHTAALYGRKGESDEEIFAANLEFPFLLVQKAIRYGVKRFISTHTALPAATNVYALSKHQFSAWLRYYSSRIQVTELIPEYFYGPGDGQWKFVTMVLTAIAEGKDEISFTAGDQQRDFIYIDDAVSAFVTVAKNEPNTQSPLQFPVGSGKTISIKDLVNLCGKVSGNKHTRFSFGTIASRPAEKEMVVCDTTALQALGWSCLTSLEQGILNTWNGINAR